MERKQVKYDQKDRFPKIDSTSNAVIFAFGITVLFALYEFLEETYLSHMPSWGAYTFIFVAVFALSLVLLLSLKKNNRKKELAIREINEKLMESEQLLSTSQKMASVGSFVMELENKTWICTPEVYRICGIDEKYPHTFDGLNVLIHPNWRNEWLQHFTLASSEKVYLDFEHKIIRVDDQSERWLHSFIETELDEQLNPVRIVLMIQDITDRKETEERLQLWFHAVEQSPVSIVATNLDGNIEYANPKAVEMTGYSLEELLGQNPRVLKSGHTSSEEYVELWRNLVSGNEWKMFFHNKRKNGELYWESAVIFPVMDSYGTINHYMAIKEDVTELKQTQENLALNESRFSHVTNQSRTVVWELDTKGMFTYVNNIVASVYGYTPEELVGKKYHYDLYPEALRQELRERDFEVFWNSLNVISIDTPIERKDGSLVWVSKSGSPIKDSQNNVIGYQGSDTDITERKQAEHFLQESNRRTQQQRIALSEFVVDESFVTVEMEAAMQRITKVVSDALNASQVSIWTFSDDISQLICRSLYEAETDTHSEGAVLNRSESPFYFDTLYEDRRISVEDVIGDPRTNELAEIYLKPTGITSLLDTVFMFEGKITGIVCIEHKGEKRQWYPDEEAFADRVASLVAQLFANDKRKQAEMTVRQKQEQFKTLFIDSPIAIAIYDLDSRVIVDANPIAQSFGMMTEQTIDAWFEASSASNEVNNWIEKAATEGPQQFEWAVRSSDGELTWKNISLKTLEIDGKTHGLMTSIDITKQKQAEQDRVAREAAEQANRAKSAFLSNMSHEIRTPLNAIIGFAQILKRDTSLAPKQNEQVQTILRSGEHLIKLINNILDLSKIEAGFLSVNAIDFNLLDLLKDIEMMFTMRTKEKGLDYYLEINDDIPEFVTGDEAKLRQVLINLLGNAIKFTKSGSITLRVLLDEAEQENVWKSPEDAKSVCLRFEIEDTGDGISNEDKERIFQSFYQTETGKQAGGTGLGLAISKNLIELMGGKLSLESEVGKGSTFRFTVPLKCATKAVEKQPSLLKNVVGLETGSGPFRILIVDDLQDNRDMLVEMLQPIGFQIEQASNGQEALNLFEQWDPHAIIMDMRMPVMDGYEATKRIKATVKGRAVLLIALTASALDHDMERIYATGADAFLSKPFQVEQLFTILSKLPGLRYTFTSNSEIEQQVVENRPLTNEDIAELPDDLVQLMYQAVELGKMSQFRELTIQVERLNPFIALELQRLAKKYEYEKLMTLLQNEGE